jgi:hypothetical protein
MRRSPSVRPRPASRPSTSSISRHPARAVAIPPELSLFARIEGLAGKEAIRTVAPHEHSREQRKAPGRRLRGLDRFRTRRERAERIA